MGRNTTRKEDGVWIDRDRVRQELANNLGTYGFEYVQARFPASDKVLKKLLGTLPGRVRAESASNFAKFLGVELQAITLQDDPRSLMDRIRTRHWPLCNDTWLGSEARIRQTHLWLELMIEDSLLAGSRMVEFDDLEDVLSAGLMISRLRGILQTFDSSDFELLDRLGRVVAQALGRLQIIWGNDHPSVRAMLGDFWHNDPTNHPYWSKPDSELPTGSPLLERWETSFSKSLRDFEISSEAFPVGSTEHSRAC